MKKRYLGLLLLPLMIAACSGQAGGNSIPDYSYNSHTINHERKTGGPGPAYYGKPYAQAYYGAACP